MEKFKEALKTKHGKTPGEDNMKFWTLKISRRLVSWQTSVFLITYERENARRLEKQNCPTSTKERWEKVENDRVINVMNACYKLYCKLFYENLKVQAEKLLFQCQSGFGNGSSWIEPLFSKKFLIKKR